MKKFLLFLILPVCLLFCAIGCQSGEVKGRFYTVTEAYENGYLTLEQVKSIAYYHNGGTKYNEDIMGAAYTPLPKSPETLSDDTQRAIKQAYREFFWTEERIAKDEEFLDEKFEASITEYDGTYGTGVAVMIRDNFSGFAEVIWYERIDGVTIFYHDGQKIYIWVG